MTLDIAQARADYDAMPHVLTVDEIQGWFDKYAEPLLTAFEARSGDADELVRLKARISVLEEALLRIEGQAVCVGMDGPEGNELWLTEIAGIARTALGETACADRDTSINTTK